jgi:hypothetical protein
MNSRSSLQTQRHRHASSEPTIWRVIVPETRDVYVLHQVSLDLSLDVSHALHAIRELPKANKSFWWSMDILLLFTDRILADVVIDQVSGDNALMLIH